jgi:hypothetical protein
MTNLKQPAPNDRWVPWENVDRASGERASYRRNRQIDFPTGSLTTDGQGNIFARPLTKTLWCFGDIVEQAFGLYDEKRRWGDKEPEARGCAGCPVAAHCSKVAQERVFSSPDLLRLRDEWSAATALAPASQRYLHPTWAAFVHGCEAHSWHDCNDAALIDEAEYRVTQKRKRDARRVADKRSRNKARPQAVPRELAARIDAYRDARALDMVIASLDPSAAPLWLRNRSPERRELLANAWWAREILRETGAKGSGRQVAEMLVAKLRAPSPLPHHFTKVVEQALRRTDQLLEDGVWPEFEAEPSTARRRAGAGMSPAAITWLLDD